MPREAGPGAVRAGRGQLCAHSPTLGPRLEELVQGTETSVWPGLGPAQTSLPPPSADTALAPVPKRPPEKPLELSFKILGSRVCGRTTLVENSSATWLGKRKSGLTSLTPPPRPGAIGLCWDPESRGSVPGPRGRTNKM